MHKTPYLSIYHRHDGTQYKGSFHLGTDLEVARVICAEAALYRREVSRVELTDNEWQPIETFHKPESEL